MQNEINDKIRLLYVEDDDIARENAVEYLQDFFTNIYEAPDALTALKLYEEINPQIIITDIQMPKLNGLEFIKKIRQKDKKTQIIVLSAYSNKEYLFEAIELQLVKYLTKPINEKELENSILQAINSIENDNSNIIKLKENYIFDSYNLTLFKDKKLIKLRTKELELLSLLIKNKNRFVSYEEIENWVWRDLVMTKDALKTLIKNLKTKLPEDTIINLSGTGYKIDV